MTANLFKERYRNHTKSFKDKKYANEMEQSKYICDRKEKKRVFAIKLEILKQAATYAIKAR